MTPEGRVKAEIKAWLKAQGAYFFFPVQTGYGATTLDILCCLNGRFVGIECKAGFNKLTNRQSRVINEIRAAGGWAFEARSLDDVIRNLAACQSQEWSEKATTYAAQFL